MLFSLPITRWLVSILKPHGGDVTLTILVSFGAIHTTTMAVTHAIYDLVCRREYIQPLRDELEQVIAEDGQDADGDGFFKLKKKSFTKLRKLDSFLKESQRFSPPGYGEFIVET